MKKKILIALVVGLALVPTAALAHTEGAPLVVDLLAGQTEDIGDVLVWNDADYLYVKLVSTGDCMLQTHVHVGTSLADFPLTKKGNPIPGHFDYSDPHACVNDYTYEIALAWSPGTELYIAAHAATGVEESMWVYSDGDESFTAYTGPGTASYPCTASTRNGTAVAAWQHPAWGSVTSQFTYGTWIWEAYRAVDPICGTVVDFEETFDIPGDISDGTLWVTADNGYEAYLNGTLLLSDGLSGDWRNSDLTESFVTTASGAWSSIEIATWLQLTGNTLRFETANEYFNTDDGHGSAGTVDSNPGGLIYEAEIIYYADGETAWGDGTGFLGKNWATYFTYTVQVHATLYADGSIGCPGADDLSHPDGTVSLVPESGGVRFFINLQGAEPNRTYTVAVSKEPSCGDAHFWYNAFITDGSGDASFSEFYPVSPGNYNLLVNMVTDASGLSDPKHREIGTTDAIVVVP